MTGPPPERIGMPKTTCKLIGENGNVFNLIGIAQRALRKDGKYDEATEMADKIMNECKSYNESLCVLMEYVEEPDEEELKEDSFN